MPLAYQVPGCVPAGWVVASSWRLLFCPAVITNSWSPASEGVIWLATKATPPCSGMAWLNTGVVALSDHSGCWYCRITLRVVPLTTNRLSSVPSLKSPDWNEVPGSHCGGVADPVCSGVQCHWLDRKLRLSAYSPLSWPSATAVGM